MSVESRSVPLLGDISLEFVQQIEHSLNTGYWPSRIAGLEGELQQRSGRPSHQIQIRGVLFGSDAIKQLERLQEAAAKGEELTFAYNITTALQLKKVVILEFHVIEDAGLPNCYHYNLRLKESAELPPPGLAGVSGEFDEFDLSFDDNLLDKLQEEAEKIAGTVEKALNTIEQVKGMTNLALGNFIQPFEGTVSKVQNLTEAYSLETSIMEKIFEEPGN